MISFQLDDEVKAVQETVRKFAEAQIRPTMRECEEKGELPEELCKKYHELGISMIDVPESAGGVGMGLVASAVVQEELAYGDPGTTAALPGPGQAAAAVIALGTGEQQEKLLSPFAEPGAYNARGAVALLEKDRGQELWDMETTAKADGDKYVLNGKKVFVENGGIAELTIVFAKADDKEGWDGIKAFAVKKDNPGLRQGERYALLGLNSLSVSEVILENCEVSKDDVLSGASDTKAGVRAMLNRHLPIQAARTIGTARAATDYAIKYAQERIAFGKPIAHFQALAFLMADMATEVNAGRWVTWQAAWAVDNNTRDATLLVSQAMAQANEMGIFATDNAVQILGGHGYIQDHPVEKWMRDAKTLAVLSGTTSLHEHIAGEEIIEKALAKKQKKAARV